MAWPCWLARVLALSRAQKGRGQHAQQGGGVVKIPPRFHGSISGLKCVMKLGMKLLSRKGAAVCEGMEAAFLALLSVFFSSVVAFFPLAGPGHLLDISQAATYNMEKRIIFFPSWTTSRNKNLNTLALISSRSECPVQVEAREVVQRKRGELGFQGCIVF